MEEKDTAGGDLIDSPDKSVGKSSGEFFLYAQSGDEWFKVTRQNGSQQLGEYIAVDRGDTIEIRHPRHLRFRDNHRSAG